MSVESAVGRAWNHELAGTWVERDTTYWINTIPWPRLVRVGSINWPRLQAQISAKATLLELRVASGASFPDGCKENRSRAVGEPSDGRTELEP